MSTEQKTEGNELNKLMLTTTTSTFANKAKDILYKNGIKAEIKKVQGGTAVGCLYGIEISSEDYNHAESLLREEKIRVIAVKEVPS